MGVPGYRDPQACPFCGYVDPDLWEYKDGETDTVCACCGQSVTVCIEVERTYRVEPKGVAPLPESEPVPDRAERLASRHTRYDGSAR